MPRLFTYRPPPTWPNQIDEQQTPTKSGTVVSKYFKTDKVLAIGFERRKWTNTPFKKTIQYFAPLSKLIKEMPLF